MEGGCFSGTFSVEKFQKSQKISLSEIAAGSMGFSFFFVSFEFLVDTQKN